MYLSLVVTLRTLRSNALEERAFWHSYPIHISKATHPPRWQDKCYLRSACDLRNSGSLSDAISERLKFWDALGMFSVRHEKAWAYSRYYCLELPVSAHDLSLLISGPLFPLFPLFSPELETAVLRLGEAPQNPTFLEGVAAAMSVLRLNVPSLKLFDMPCT